LVSREDLRELGGEKEEEAKIPVQVKIVMK